MIQDGGQNSLNDLFSKRGFTLIELLVVISIISLLSSVVLSSLSSAREKSRDTKRIRDLREMQKAVELYYNDHGQYPSTNDNWRAANTNCYDSQYGSWGYGSDGFIPGIVPNYMDRLPEDPNPIEGGCYFYRSDGQDYMILVHKTVESFDPDEGPHPLDRPAYDQQSIAVFTSGASTW